jgi:hypothetical protein
MRVGLEGDVRGNGPNGERGPFSRLFYTRLRATRRGFLQLAGSSAALTALAQAGALPACAAAGSASGSFFDAHETEILTQIVERMVDTGEPDAPAVRDTRAVATIDAFCRQLDPEITGPLPLVLRLFEYGPIVFDLSFSRFSRMSDAQKDASLEAWTTSRLGLRRMAFLALRNLALLGYYTQPETWPLIGYQGPLIERSETP